MATTSKAGDKPVKAKSTATTKPLAATKVAASGAKSSVSKTEKVLAQSASAASTTEAKAVNKTVTKTSPKAPAAAAVKKDPPVTTANARRALAPDQRRYYVEVAAYYIAEQRGFHEGSQLDDWIAAEAEIDRLLREGILNP